MNESQKDLLIKIGNGQNDFQPKGDSLEDMETFMKIVENLRYLDSNNYIEIITIHRESHSGKRNYDKVLIKLLPAGQDWLVRNSSQNNKDS